ncbi:hypothetical protein [Leptolyngbya sp. FACHB-17]|uniref:hypothetical protein n=1 Tax=unclassified Leptolyngbya TaxID=2650499 RepID=UPI0016812793|nr:hypothetical protein [Leptolyngbya sp. FACHB-17]MBD2080354.1 hypothetical protein [Leptolyngbya sp. FACHB-17]
MANFAAARANNRQLPDDLNDRIFARSTLRSSDLTAQLQLVRRLKPSVERE